MTFFDYAHTAFAVSHALKTSEKVQRVAALLRRADDDGDLYQIAVWFAHGPFPPGAGRSISVGGALERQAYAAIVGDESGASGTLDYEIFVACRTMSGSTTDAIRMLLEARIRGGHDTLVRSEGLTVAQVQALYEALAATRGNAARLAILERKIRRGVR